MSTTPLPIAAFFRAMQAGAAAEASMAQLFADDAVYIEPFSGRPTTHKGKEAIMATMRAGWAYPLPDMKIELDSVEVSGNEIVVAWICRSPGLPGGLGRGVNRFSLDGGLISKLETTIST
jgi:uncharacterized protein (TIGR02246 family)